MRIRNRDRFFLFSYFISIIMLGSILLWLPLSWNGQERLRYVDALFTATSAVCVTGLTVVDTAGFSPFGKTVVLLLIQFGGLGIITLTTIFLANPRGKISLSSRKLIGDYSIATVEQNPRRIIRNILLVTLSLEAIGALAMYPVFRGAVDRRPLFHSIFHAVSAFCNAGFSTFSDNLEGFVASPTVSFVVMGLIVSGGLGFVVLQDIARRGLGARRAFALHSRLVIAISLTLIIGGAAVFLVFEWRNAYGDLTVGQKLMAALFQSVTPRTAGFDTIPQASLSFPSRVFTMFLMWIGASPASTGGGVKTTTFFIVLVMILRGAEAREDIRILDRKLSAGSVSRGMMFALRAIAIIAVSVFALTMTELFLSPSGEKYFLQIAYEVFSAFGTVGLSLGLTPQLSSLGKLIVVATMIAGRVGMPALAISLPRRLPRTDVDFPEEEVLIA